jgi:hypothetical protein
VGSANSASLGIKGVVRKIYGYEISQPSLGNYSGPFDGPLAINPIQVTPTASDTWFLAVLFYNALLYSTQAGAPAANCAINFGYKTTVWNRYPNASFNTINGLRDVSGPNPVPGPNASSFMTNALMGNMSHEMVNASGKWEFAPYGISGSPNLRVVGNGCQFFGIEYKN